MDIVIDIQGFRDVEENFIPKEVTVLAINATINGLWRTLDYDITLSIWRFIREFHKYREHFNLYVKFYHIYKKITIFYASILRFEDVTKRSMLQLDNADNLCFLYMGEVYKKWNCDKKDDRIPQYNIY